MAENTVGNVAADAPKDAHEEEWDPIEFEGGSPLSIRFNHDHFWHHLRPDPKVDGRWILNFQRVPGLSHQFDKTLV